MNRLKKGLLSVAGLVALVFVGVMESHEARSRKHANETKIKMQSGLVDMDVSPPTGANPEITFPSDYED